MCVLLKKYEHFWDRLPYDETDTKALKQDWSKWKNAEEDQSSSDGVYVCV